LPTKKQRQKTKMALRTAAYGAGKLKDELLLLRVNLP